MGTGGDRTSCTPVGTIAPQADLLTVETPVASTTADHPALLRQAPNNWNFDLTYDKKGFAGRIGATHNDANIFAYNFQNGADGGIKGPNGDVYLYPHTQLDAQASYWIPNGHGLQAVVSLLNLTNEVFGFYQGSERFPIQREFYDRTVSFGLRWTLDPEALVGRSQTGRTIALRPFMGVMGMPSDESGWRPSWTPRPQGGNLDCDPSEVPPGP